MSSGIPTPDGSAGLLSPPTIAPKPQRALACLACAQRKVKCDRKTPCTNCSKAGVACISGTSIPRQRRRRFPERELLDRLRLYEHLLQENKIPFQPLHGASIHSSTLASADSVPSDGCAEKSSLLPSEKATMPTSGTPQAKSLWDAMNQGAQNRDHGSAEEEEEDSDEDANHTASSPHVLRLGEVFRAWDQVYSNDLLRREYLLFCAPNTGVDVAALHPSQAHMFKLWQIYLENVDPLLKITHTPTLQPCIIDAASDMTNINPNLEALLFSIYCMAIFSLDEVACETMFRTRREVTIRRYQLGAREALLRCDFMKSSNRDCLTALLLYLMSVKPDVHPRSLTSILGIAMRTAERMGLNTEPANARHAALEAELRRRLWWALVLFDARIVEMSNGSRSATLIPTWDCKVAANVSDVDLRAETKNVAAATGHRQYPSEAVFVVMRTLVADCVRRAPSHLDFINPVLKSVASPTLVNASTESSRWTALEALLESDLLSCCDTENPLHYMTIWTARFALAKARFIQHLATFSPSNEEQRDAGLSYARTMLECDTRLMASPLIKRFRWSVYIQMPFPAYVHLVHDLRKRPHGAHVELAWKAIGDNSAARLLHSVHTDYAVEKTPHFPFFKILARFVLQAWAVWDQTTGGLQETPAVVTQLRLMLARVDQELRTRAVALEDCALGVDSADLGVDDLLNFDGFDFQYGPLSSMGASTFSTDPSQLSASLNDGQWDWYGSTWGAMPGQRW